MKKIICLCFLVILSGCGGGTEKKEAQVSMVKEEQLLQFSEVQSGETLAVMETSMGNIVLRMFPKQAPKAVENFITHAQDGYYDGVSFHRVISDFMIQSGDPKGNGTGGESIWGDVFENEISDQLYHFSGALAMANAGPNTNGSQFFIVQQHDGSDASFAKQFTSIHSEAVRAKYQSVGGTPYLDGAYTVFGQVEEGMDVVHAIASVEVDANDKPLEQIVIQRITIKQA